MVEYNLPMIKDEIIQLNPWWENGYKNRKTISRFGYVDKLMGNKTKLIQLITGARRVGKTYILKEIIGRLIEKENPKSILYITAKLPNISGREVMEILDEYKQIFKTKKLPKYLFLDEVQDLKNWQTQIKYLYDNYSMKIFVSGSSSLVLTKETSKLTGRFILTHVYPLSFAEFKLFRKTAKVDEYLNIGGYPEYVISGQREVLMDTIEGILYRDLLSYYGIRNPVMLKDLLQLLCDKISTPVSDKLVARDLKIDIKTAQFYLQYLQDVFLIYPLYREGRSHKKVKGFSPKYYLNDTGLLRLYSKTVREGHLAENAVFIELSRKARQERSEICYRITEKGEEIDFVDNGRLFDVKMGELPIDYREDVVYVVKKINKKHPAKQIKIEDLLALRTKKELTMWP